jgi:hypothetical protein
MCAPFTAFNNPRRVVSTSGNSGIPAPHMCFVIARPKADAIQQRQVFGALHSGLPRRFAPRNDDESLVALQKSRYQHAQTLVMV